MLKTLEGRGLIRRIPDERDGRYKKIVFTERASEIESAIKDEIMKSERLLLTGISQEEKEEFLRIAEKMLGNLE